MKNLIRIEHLTKRYGNYVAVDNLSFTADKGKIYGFLGPNGAGKSTTMNMMTGYLSSTSGTVTIDGFDIVAEPEQAKSRIGYLPESPPVYPDMTVEEYLLFVAELKRVPKRERRKAAEDSMARTEINDVRGRLIKNLSKGYRQRVGLAQAIINDPQVIILDEPTVGLDPEQQKEMFDYIRTLRDDHIVILSSHILSDVSAVCDEVWIINNGRLIASDTPENLRRHAASGQRVTLKVRGDITPGELQERISAADGVTSVEVSAQSGGEMTAVISSDCGEDIRPVISRTVFDLGLDLLSINAEETSLEDVYLTLTAEEPADGQDGGAEEDAAGEEDADMKEEPADEEDGGAENPDGTETGETPEEEADDVSNN